ncbi:glutamyl-tRNA reductase [Candidatus Poribacteria bacterium]
MFVIAVGVNHKRTPVEIREKLAFNDTQLSTLFERLKSTEKIAGCVIISTCNRTEIYAASKDIDAALSEIWKLLSDESGIEVDQLQDYLYNSTCQQAIAHLFKVTSGLDSMILGEQEILGQVARAYQTACENAASNAVLNVLFQKALKVGKQVQTETRIGSGASSVGSAAVELARQVFVDIQDCSILLIGAGEMGRLVARNLANNCASEMMVCNRSHDKAQEVASQFGGHAVPFEELSECLQQADLVVSCTAAPDYILTKDQLASLAETRGSKSVFLIDLAVPRDIDPQSTELECVHLYNVDDLQTIVDEGLGEREQEAEKANRIVENAVDNFMKWLNSRAAIPAIKALCQKGEEIRDAELEKALRKFGNLTTREEKILRSMAHAITNRITNAPIIKLREYSQTDQGHMYAQILLDLFGLQVRIDDEDEEDRQPEPDAVRQTIPARK